MPATEINGETAAMFAYSGKLAPPPMPPSLARLGAPPNLSGLFEGIAMSVLDKAATAELVAFLTKITEDLTTDSVKVKAAAAGYTAADVAGALGLAAPAIKLVQQGIGLAKQVSSLARQQKSGEQPADGTVGDDPRITV